MTRYYMLMEYLVPVYIDVKETGAKNSIRSVNDVLPSCSYEGMLIITSPQDFTEKEKHDYYRDTVGIGLPKKRIYQKLDKQIVIYIVYTNIDIGHFLIKAQNMEKTYELATIIRSYFAIYRGLQNSGFCTRILYEFCRIPQSDWDQKRIILEAKVCHENWDPSEVNEMQSGYNIGISDLHELSVYIRKIWDNRDLIETLNHLMESRRLFFGDMSGSYYHFHYKHDRQILKKRDMERMYYENRYRYESSFTAAFKGVERFFCVNRIKHHEIHDLLSKCVYDDVEPNTIYIRHHETFSKMKREVTYKEMIVHFLDIRNAVTAHGNKSPKVPICEDNVFEIQLFLKEILSKTIWGFGGIHVKCYGKRLLP